jgi:hypothetical protein
MCVAVVVAALIIINPLRFKGQVLRDERVTVQLTNSVHPVQLGFESELVRIEVGCDQYHVCAHIDHDPWGDVGEVSLGEYAVADILEQGMGSVYDKRNQAEVATVEIWFYSFICGPLCGEGSRSFYLPDGTLFLRVTDYVS